MRICIVASNASFILGGEAILPLHYFSGLRAAGHDVWLVTHARCRAELEQQFPDAIDHILFVRDDWMQHLCFRIGRCLPRRIAESTTEFCILAITQYHQRAILRRLVAGEGIEIIHQPTPVSPRTPSLFTRMGARVVIGPMNGGMDFPPAFHKHESWITRTLLAAARALSNFVNRIFPGKRYASALLVANRRTLNALPSGLSGRVIHLSENGVDISLWQPPAHRDASAPPHFLFIGRLVDWKALDMAIEALAQVPNATLDVIGNGPMLHAWKSAAKSAGVAERVNFLGWQTQQQCSEHMQTATALILPSLLECGGAVVLEAMAAGLAVIATRWGGPAEYLDETCGILIDCDSRDEVVHGIVSAMQRLATDPDLAHSLGRAGRARVLAHFDWSRKIESIIGIYAMLCAEPLSREMYLPGVVPVATRILSQPHHAPNAPAPPQN